MEAHEDVIFGALQMGEDELDRLERQIAILSELKADCEERKDPWLIYLCQAIGSIEATFRKEMRSIRNLQNDYDRTQRQKTLKEMN